MTSLLEQLAETEVVLAWDHEHGVVELSVIELVFDPHELRIPKGMLHAGRWVHSPLAGDVPGEGIHRYVVPDPHRLDVPEPKKPRKNYYVHPQDHPFFQAHPVSPENVLRYYDMADEGTREQGRAWYREIHRLAGTYIAPGNPEEGGILLSTYSPQTSWPINMMNAARSADRGYGIGPGEGVMASNDQARKANKAIAGEGIDKLMTTAKTHSFGVLIKQGDDSPDDPYGHVVIDTHAVNIAAGGDIRGNKGGYGAAPIDNARYHEYVADQYREAARRISEREGRLMKPHELQAITWLVQQRMSQAEDVAMIESGDLKLRGAAKGRLSAQKKAWKRWVAYARERGIPLQVGVSAPPPGVMAAQIAYAEFIDLMGPGGLAVQLAGWEDEPRDPLTGKWTTWYHGTPHAAEARQIARSGLKSGISDKRPYYTLASHPDEAMMWAGKHGAIVEIHMPESEQEKYLTSPPGEQGFLGPARISGIKRFIPSKYIHRVIYMDQANEPGLATELASVAGHHVPGTSYSYRHGWQPLSGMSPHPSEAEAGAVAVIRGGKWKFKRTPKAGDWIADAHGDQGHVFGVSDDGKWVAAQFNQTRAGGIARREIINTERGDVPQLWYAKDETPQQGQDWIRVKAGGVPLSEEKPAAPATFDQWKQTPSRPVIHGVPQGSDQWAQVMPPVPIKPGDHVADADGRILAVIAVKGSRAKVADSSLFGSVKWVDRAGLHRPTHPPQPPRREHPSLSPPGDAVAPGTRQLVLPGMPGSEFGHNSPEVKALRKEITSGALEWAEKKPARVSAPPSQGALSSTKFVHLDDGRDVLVKDSESADWNDSEELAYYVSQAIGAGMPALARDPKHPRLLIEDKVNGTVAWEYLDREAVPGGNWDGYSYNEARDELIAANPQIGLLDYLTGNQDRHEGNWMVDDTGHVTPIDMGLAGFLDDTNSPFWMGDEGTWDPEEVAKLEKNLERLKPEFDRMGKGAWYKEMIYKADQLSSSYGLG